MLLDAGRPDAALVEFGKAASGADGPSPTLAARTSDALVGLGRRDEALAGLRASIVDYPEYAVTRRALGRLLLARGDVRGALAQFRAAVDVDPFDPDTQGALADLYAAGGQATLAERHARYRRILQSAEPPPASR
ncbi:MAG: tetratricopeptide repeat protein [Deltaproteobacteria bacterium]|nr:tetratricopeptide repeat protein [Deltaproteobacteria bacterium]